MEGFWRLILTERDALCSPEASSAMRGGRPATSSVIASNSRLSRDEPYGGSKVSDGVSRSALREGNVISAGSLEPREATVWNLIRG